MLYFLLRNRVNLALYPLRNYHKTRARGILFRTLVLLILPYWIYSVTSNLFASWHFVPGFKVLVIIHFITVLLSGMFVLLIISGVPQALHFNFLAPDNMLLSALPLDKAVINKYRFWEIYLSNSTVFFLFGLPVIIAGLVILKISPPAAALLLCGMLLFLVVPAGLSSLVSILLARFLPIKRTKYLSSIIMGVMIIGLWAFLQFFRLSRLDPFSGNFDSALFNSLVQSRELYISRILPSTWAANMLKGLADHQASVILLNLLLLLVTAVIIFQLAFRLCGQIENIIQARAKRVVIPVSVQNKNGAITSYTRVVRPLHVIFAQISKDLKLYFRDSRFVTQIFFYFSLIIVLPFLFRETLIVTNETFTHYAPFTCMMFTTIFMAGGLTARGIPLERRALNYNRLAPNDDILYITAKVATGFFLTTAALIVGLAITVFLARSPVQVVLMVIVILILNTFGAAAIGLATGTSNANLDWENPRQMLTENGNIILNLAGMVYLSGGILVLFVGMKFLALIPAMIIFSLYTLLWCVFCVVFSLRRFCNIGTTR